MASYSWFNFVEMAALAIPFTTYLALLMMPLDSLTHPAVSYLISTRLDWKLLLHRPKLEESSNAFTGCTWRREHVFFARFVTRLTLSPVPSCSLLSYPVLTLIPHENAVETFLTTIPRILLVNSGQYSVQPDRFRIETDYA